MVNKRPDVTTDNAFCLYCLNEGKGDRNDPEFRRLLDFLDYPGRTNRIIRYCLARKSFVLDPEGRHCDNYRTIYDDPAFG